MDIQSRLRDLQLLQLLSGTLGQQVWLADDSLGNGTSLQPWLGFVRLCNVGLIPLLLILLSSRYQLRVQSYERENCTAETNFARVKS